jgi:hypothetical protein
MEKPCEPKTATGDSSDGSPSSPDAQNQTNTMKSDISDGSDGSDGSLEALASKTKKLERLEGKWEDKCFLCGFQGRMDYQITEFNDSWAFLCGSCGDKLTKEISEVKP